MKKNTFRNPIQPGWVNVRKKVIITLSNEINIATNETHIDWDGDDYVSFPNDDADLEKAYRESELNITELLDGFGSIARNRADNFNKLMNNYKLPEEQRQNAARLYWFWHDIAENCKGWKIEEIDID